MKSNHVATSNEESHVVMSEEKTHMEGSYYMENQIEFIIKLLINAERKFQIIYY